MTRRAGPLVLLLASGCGGDEPAPAFAPPADPPRSGGPTAPADPVRPAPARAAPPVEAEPFSRATSEPEGPRALESAAGARWWEDVAAAARRALAAPATGR